MNNNDLIWKIVGGLPASGYWDPLGLATDKDDRTLSFYRAAELKHGRVSMVAALGVLFQGLNTGTKAFSINIISFWNLSLFLFIRYPSKPNFHWNKHVRSRKESLLRKSWCSNPSNWFNIIIINNNNKLTYNIFL